MKKLSTLFSVLVIVFATVMILPEFCQARLRNVTVQSEGTGATAKGAIYDAVTQALAKVNGMEIATKTSYAIAEASMENNQNEAYFSSEAFKQQIKTVTQGVIKEYQVLSLEQNSGMNNLWLANIEVTIAKYQVSKQAQRLRMALVPFRINSNASDKQKATKLEQLFAQSLVSYLTQTRKFAILDREYLSEKNMELGLIKNGNVPVDELARLGNTLGADYIIVGSVDDVIDNRWKQSMKNADKQFTMHNFGAQLSYRIIDAATGQVKFSDTYNKVDELNGSKSDYMMLANLVADSIGEKIVNAIYPIVVTSVRGKTVYLAQGGKTLKVGQKMELIRYGDSIIDPYTNESLGREEITVGMIRVDKVQAKLSQAQVIDSSIDLASEFSPESFVARPLQKTNPSVSKNQHHQQIKTSIEKDFKKFAEVNDEDW